MAVTDSSAAETTAWTLPAFRARDAHHRYVELDEQAKDERSKRDRAVREAIDGGAKVPEVARFMGLSRSTIYGIIGTEA